LLTRGGLAFVVVAMSAASPIPSTAVLASGSLSRGVMQFQPRLPAPSNWSGRAVAVDVDAGNQHRLAASESGGLYLSGDAGAHWHHVDALPPTRLTDARFDPVNANVIVVSAWSDTHTVDNGGIWISTNGGADWTRPPSANGCTTTANNAWGIAFAPPTDDVYVGLDCGVAVSHDQGGSWQVTTLEATYAITATASSTPGGATTVDTCSASGHQQSTNSGAGFSLVGSIPGCNQTGVHTITHSPLEQGVLFVTSGVGIKESDDSGLTWQALSSAPYVSRAPETLAVRARDGDQHQFDLYFGDGYGVERVTCGDVSGARRCPSFPPGLPSGYLNIPHTDEQDIGFDPSTHCPVMVASDGGVEGSTDCGSTYQILGGGAGGYNALQVYGLASTQLVGRSDLFFGTQDNTIWASTDGGLSWPAMEYQATHPDGTHCGFHPTLTCANDGPFIHAPPTATSDLGSFAVSGWDTGLVYRAPADFTSTSGFPSPPGQSFLTGTVSWDWYMDGGPFPLGSGVWLAWATPGQTLYRTPDNGTTWNVVTTISGSTLVDQPVISGSAANATMYQPVRNPGGAVRLKQITGIGTGAVNVADANGSGTHTLGNLALSGVTWSVVDGEGTFGRGVALAVDPNDDQHLLAADLHQNAVVETIDGGQHWNTRSDITQAVTGSGTLQFSPTWPFGAQVRAISFDPWNSNDIVIGTEAAGVIESTDGGTTFAQVPGSDAIPSITSFAFERATGSVVVGSYGRGLWKLYWPTVPSGFALCTAQCFTAPSPDQWIDPAGTLKPSQNVPFSLVAVNAAGAPVPNTGVRLSFNGAGSATADGKPLSATGQTLVTDAKGAVTMTFTTSPKALVSGIDSITVASSAAALAAGQVGPPLRTVAAYNYASVAGYVLAPNPLAKTGSLKPGLNARFTVKAVSAGGGPVAGAALWVTLVKKGAKGAIWPDAGAVLVPTAGGGPPTWYTGTSGTSPVVYFAGTAPPGSTDVVEAENSLSSPSITATDSYST
jgi:hypothetical protein